MYHKWISPLDTRDIESEFAIYSGAIKRVGDDFSWLAATLADLAREMKWPDRSVRRIEKSVEDSERAKAKNLIATKQKIGYVLNVNRSDVFVIV